MKVVLNTFACGGIEAFSGPDIEAGVRKALRHYTQGKGSSDRVPPDFPRCFGTLEVGCSGADLELAVDPEVRAALERKAREVDGLSVEQIAAHAVLAYLADLDRASGGEAHSLAWV
jgi:hypothetical protein